MTRTSPAQPQASSGDPSETEADTAVSIAAARHPELAAAIAGYFRHVSVEDQPTSADEVLTIVTGHLRTGRSRPPGEVRIRSYNPPVGGDGWGGTSTVIDIVNDDMPYLVDTVVGAITAAGLTANRVLHPILAVQRDADGTLVEIAGESVWGADPVATLRESWMHVLVDRLTDAERIEAVEAELTQALDQVRAVVTDTPAMVALARQVAVELRGSFRPTPDGFEAADLLDWLASGNFTFLGYRQGGSAAAVAPAAGLEPALGLLRSGGANHGDLGLPDQTGAAEGERPAVLSIGQFWAGTALGKGAPLLWVTVRSAGQPGRPAAPRTFCGLLTPQARNADVTTVPVLRQTVREVLTELGATPDSYSGQRAMELLATYPRGELFWADRHQVVEVVSGQLQLASRRRLRVFLQPDPQGRFMSVLVFLPRDRYTTARRLAMQRVLLEELHGTDITYTARIGESLLAAVHFTVLTDPSQPIRPDLDELTGRLRDTIRTWEDRLVTTVVGGEDDLDAAGALSRYAEAFDEAYKEVYEVDDAVTDLAILDGLTPTDDLALTISAGDDPASGERRLKLYVAGPPVSLSRVLPVLQHMGAEVVDERPFEVRRSDGTLGHIYDFGLRLDAAALPTDAARLADARQRFSDAFIAAWRGDSEVDGFNELVLAAGLSWREIAVARAYAKYLRQIGSTYSQGYVAQVLAGYPTVTANLAALFAARFDPDHRDPDRADELAGAITAELDEVTSLDADRILRTYLRLILATDRTNAYRTDIVPAPAADQSDRPDASPADGAAAGHPRGALAFKINPHQLPEIPKPVPAHEIWVYSPRVEGVHLRFGAVARGGLRWSDRPDDFRTEILGLVKAQEVKNAVIVPVGAKGGFVVKQPPTPIGDPAADRDAALAEGIACYRIFVSCLLDVTDNRGGGQVVPPPRVVRYDQDDPYLVVAADKGTATFSDIANSISADYGYWLGDAFASGGSAGYDHKGMGITARGAWESVKSHFWELGIDCQTSDFSCVGIGDMSGDVFGNGMLLSPHIRLLAAFDHRHVFVDPDPDPAASLAERRRMFDLPRSSWDDYDRSLISTGGGIWPRSAKSIPISGPMRLALGIDPAVTALAPVDLIHAILLAPADLLWNGGIGTYVKASTESNADAGDKANDALRVNGNQLRVKVVGEGGNLGVTQLGRVEFARAGGLINTDAIDNSAGVDTSDHEVNIKIAVQPLLTDGELTEAARNELLTSMTDEVGRLVLADNIAQNWLLAVSRFHAGPMLSVHARQIDALVAEGRLDRELEFLPSPAQIDARIAVGEGLTTPEMSVLVAYTKSALSAEMLASDLPSDPAFARTLVDYFPTAMRGQYAAAIAAHPLAREIVTTMAVNQTVNGGGLTYAFRLAEEMAASATDALRAYVVTTTIFQLPELLAAIQVEDHSIPAAAQDRMTLLARRLLDRASRWLLTRRPQPLDVQAEIARYADGLATLAAAMPALLRGVERDNRDRDAAALVAQGAPAALADRVAYSLYTFSNLDIIDVAAEAGRKLVDVAALYYALSAHLDFDRMLTEVTNLERGDRWHALARQAVRDDLYRSLRMITADVLSTAEPGQDVDAVIATWERDNASRLARSRSTLAEISTAGVGDLAALSVAAREIRSMIR